MKTKQFLFLAIIGLSTQLINAQATFANVTNTVTASSYLGSGAGATNNFDVVFKRNNINAGLLGTTKTAFGVNALAMPNSVSIGVGAGQFSSGLGGNTYIGQNTGSGPSALLPNTGNLNTCIGSSIIGNGSQNTIIGANCGNYGVNNIFLGTLAGKGAYGTGNGNIFIGNNTGYEDGTHGDGNIFIGHGAGFTESNSNTLVIDNAGETNNPLIWGDMAHNLIKFHGKVGISLGDNLTSTGPVGETFGNYPSNAGGVSVSNYNLFVKGGILTEEVRVSLASTWADYVFSKDYKLPTLAEVEKQIQEKGHLANVPSAKEVKENGIELGEMAKIQQEKIEELTLYIIQMNKEIQELKAKIKN